jgi:hypothetical protein
MLWSAHEKGASERFGGRWLALGVLRAAAGGGGGDETQAAGHFLCHRGGPIKGVCVDARGASEDNDDHDQRAGKRMRNHGSANRKPRTTEKMAIFRGFRSAPAPTLSRFGAEPHKTVCA